MSLPLTLILVDGPLAVLSSGRDDIAALGGSCAAGDLNRQVRPEPRPVS